MELQKKPINEVILPEHMQEFREVRNKTLKLLNANKRKNFSTDLFSVGFHTDNEQVDIIYKHKTA